MSVRALACLAVVFACQITAASAQTEAESLAAARLSYNERAYDDAITAAERARLAPELADAADLVAARAYLERYRVTAVSHDLTNARERLRRLDPSGFTPRERAELVVGLGTALFFEEAPGAAAVLFASALDAEELDADARERLLDWWASAMDRDARLRPAVDRTAMYRAVRDRMAAELSEHPASGAAAYWAVAAAAAQGDWEAAWAAALAAWVRAPLTADRGAALRADTERVVERTIIPGRARHLKREPTSVADEWAAFKLKWAAPDEH